MHDEFSAFQPSCQTFDDGFNSAGGCHYDLHDDYLVDPWLASYGLGTTDSQAIAIRNAREAAEQLQAQPSAAK